ISEPLSTWALSITIGTVLLALSVIAYRRDGPIDRSELFAPATRVLRASLLMGVPLLAILGAWLMSGSLLLLMMVVIALLPPMTVLSRKAMPLELRSFVLIVIAASLLLRPQLLSTHLDGWDVFGEYYVFNLAQSNSFWSPSPSALVPSFTEVFPFTYNAMLSVTVLPIIYSNVLGLPGEWVFKLVYYLLYSLVPVCLYQAYQKKFGKSMAFLAAFYFILFPRFYDEERRQMVGELFYGLLIFLMLREEVGPRKRLVLSIVFAASLVVSHYSLSYIYLFSIVFAYFSISVLKSVRRDARRKMITASFVLLFFAMCFSWNTFVSIYPSTQLWRFAGNIYDSFLADFLDLEARGGAISHAVAPGLSSLSILQVLDGIADRILNVFILVGVLFFFRSYKQKDFDWEYAAMVVANASIMLMVLVVPHFGPYLGEARFYHITLFCLAPMCILGGEKSIRLALKKSRKVVQIRYVGLVLLSVFLAVAFLFKVGFVYEVAGGVPTLKPVSFTGMITSEDNETKVRFNEAHVPEQDVLSATWLSMMTAKNSDVYADYAAAEHVIMAYAMKTLGWKQTLANDTKIESGGYIYLRSLNVQGILRDRSYALSYSEIAKISRLLNMTNHIYSNGGSEIYQSLDRPGSGSS
nr:DUF2206 domain-containing protein [Candidatus Njordarchaeum guaymaensis]